jgi:hypothetical protein
LRSSRAVFVLSRTTHISFSVRESPGCHSSAVVPPSQVSTYQVRSKIGTSPFDASSPQCCSTSTIFIDPPQFSELLSAASLADTNRPLF